MARVLRLAVLVGAIVLADAAVARAGFISVFLMAGNDGSATASTTNSFQFVNPSGSSQVTVNQLLGGTGTVQATTGGGSAFFGGLGVPVVLNVSDGPGFLSSATTPAGVVPTSGLGSTAPDAPATAPPGSSLLSASLSDPAANGAQVLTVSVADANGGALGSTQVTVPGGGWWVLGLAPDSTTPPPVIVPPVIVPPVDPPVTPPAGPPAGGPPTAATPEPTTLALAALGLPLVGTARWLRRKAAPGAL